MVASCSSSSTETITAKMETVRMPLQDRLTLLAYLLPSNRSSTFTRCCACQLSNEFASYLRSYARVSLELLDRWPTFVPDELRTDTGLNDLTAARVGAPLPETQRTLEKEGELSTKMEKMLAKQVPDALSTRLHPESLRSQSDPCFGEYRRQLASNGIVKARIVAHRKLVSPLLRCAALLQATLRKQIDKLGEKLRVEVAERIKANNENTRRGSELQAVKRENATLVQTLQKQVSQLEHCARSRLSWKRSCERGKT